MRSHDSNFIYIEVDGHSKPNPAYLTVVLDLVEPMLISRIPSHKIAIITFYSAQRAGYEKILNSKDARWSGLKLMSVDASQGDEAPFVLLDPVTPGGMRYSLGFRKGMERLSCGAVSVCHCRLSLYGEHKVSGRLHQGLG